MTVDNAAHLPWIKDPERVLGAVEKFLGGAWPETAERVDGSTNRGGPSGLDEKIRRRVYNDYVTAGATVQ